MTLVLNWTPNTHHIGIYVAQQKGWYRDAGIDLKIVEPTDAGAEQVVGTGQGATSASAGRSRCCPARAEGVADRLDRHDPAVQRLEPHVARERGITDAADLAGKRYGGYGGPLETELVNRLVEVRRRRPLEA